VYKCLNLVILNWTLVTYIIDGGFLLHRVIWQQNDTFHCIIDRYVDYIQGYFGSNIIVVFNEYNSNSKNIKALEQLRRTAALSGSFEVIFEETMHVTMSQKNFLANRSNKIRLISMLMQKLQSVNIVAKQTRDDANVLIIETALKN